MNSGVDVMPCSTIKKQSRESGAEIASGRARRLTNAIALVVLLVTVTSGQAQTATTSDVNLNRLAEAVKAIGQGQLSKAETLLKSVLAKSPRDADALNLLGVVCAQEQKPAEAERLFRLALAASPKHIGAHVNLGELLLT